MLGPYTSASAWDHWLRTLIPEALFLATGGWLILKGRKLTNPVQRYCVWVAFLLLCVAMSRNN